jgi:predicted nucleic acid-binding Zn ribbon protein
MEKNKNKSKYFDIERTEDLSSVLKRFLKSTGIGWMLKHKDVISVWNEVTGEEISSQTKVKGYRNGVLQVDVFSPVLKSELEQFYKDSLVDSIKSASPELGIRSIKFRLSSDNEDKSKKT